MANGLLRLHCIYLYAYSGLMYLVYRDNKTVTQNFVLTDNLFFYTNSAAAASDAGVYTMYHETQGKILNCSSVVIIAGYLTITKVLLLAECE